MRNKFKVTGLFYEIEQYKFRKYLNIIRIDSANHTPDVMVIMMNPGSSRPMNGINNNTTESEAFPDSTQFQIMQIMQNCGFEYARILNLSDLREGNSKKFYSRIVEIKEKVIAHSIFDDRRTNEFDELFVRNVPLIFGWGVNGNLKELAEVAIEKIGNTDPIGLKKEGVKYGYYHPLPQIHIKQKEWVEKITKMINSKVLSK
jgi:hypothetical protein